MFRVIDLARERGMTIPELYACQVKAQELMAAFWENPLNPYSLRLARHGHDFIVKYRLLEAHVFKQVHIVGKTMLMLEDLMPCPYYIKDDTFYVYGEDHAIMMVLHGNDLNQYLNNLSLT